jgi:hypothetical protein
MTVAWEGMGEYPVAPLDRMRAQGEKSRWHEADVPWNDLDNQGVTEPEVVYDHGPDDDD